MFIGKPRFLGRRPGRGEASVAAGARRRALWARCQGRRRARAPSTLGYPDRCVGGGGGAAGLWLAPLGPVWRPPP